MSPEIWISMGSNVGNRFGYLHFALEHLARLGTLQRMSSIYETEPWGKRDQPDFLNAVCSLYGDITSPVQFLDELHRIEMEAGRATPNRWGARTLDLDILFWGAVICSSPALIIPHSCLMQRKFVLVPLAQIAPDLLHPITQESMMDLLQRCPDSSEVRSIAEFHELRTAQPWKATEGSEALPNSRRSVCP
ncbi:MAG: 2-amino-4-hydroxy-6-hydroxymethyldihydropteridine diphosphokinase [bacterium]